jgi:hypothetical protein
MLYKAVANRKVGVDARKWEANDSQMKELTQSQVQKQRLLLHLVLSFQTAQLVAVGLKQR